MPFWFIAWIFFEHVAGDEERMKRHSDIISWKHLRLWANVLAEGHETLKIAYLTKRSPETADITMADTMLPIV